MMHPILMDEEAPGPARGRGKFYSFRVERMSLKKI